MVDSSGGIASIVTGAIDQRPNDYSGAYPRIGANARRGRAGARCPKRSDRSRSIRRKAMLVSANQGGHGPHVARWCTFPKRRTAFSASGSCSRAQERHDPLSLLRISYDTLDGGARRLLPVWARFCPSIRWPSASSHWARAARRPDAAALLRQTVRRDLLFAAGTGSRAPHGAPLSRMVGARDLSSLSSIACLRSSARSCSAKRSSASCCAPRSRLPSPSYEQHDVPVRAALRALASRAANRLPSWASIRRKSSCRRSPDRAVSVPRLADLGRTLGVRARVSPAHGHEPPRRLVQHAGWRVRIALWPRLRQRRHGLARGLAAAARRSRARAAVAARALARALRASSSPSRTMSCTLPCTGAALA